TSPAQPTPTKNYALSGITGSVRAGALPIAGASVQVYAAGTTGNGSAPTALLSTPVTTDSTGAFTAGNVTCPYSNSVVYLVARGGSATGSGSSNSAIALASVIGSCSAIKSGAGVIVDEATTVATAWALAPFLATGGQIGATATNSTGIGLAATTALNLVNPATGKAPGVAFPATGTAPTAKINTFANVLNGCVAAGSSSSTACAQLFAASSVNRAAPTNTLDAAMNIAKLLDANVASVYGLASGSAAYSPSLSTPPNDWTLFATYSGGGMNGPSALSIDSQGNVWVANYFGIASLF